MDVSYYTDYSYSRGGNVIEKRLFHILIILLCVSLIAAGTMACLQTMQTQVKLFSQQGLWLGQREHMFLEIKSGKQTLVIVMFLSGEYQISEQRKSN